jgi:hypothetical protein
MNLSRKNELTKDRMKQQNLGKEINHFTPRHRFFKRWVLVILGVILLVYGSLCALINTFDLYLAIQSHGRAVLLARITEPLIALFLIIPSGILLIILAAVNWQNDLTIFEKGLVIRKRNQEIVWPWNVIERFDNQITLVGFSGTIITAHRKIILVDKQQNILSFRDQYDRMDELVTHLRRHILPGLFNRKYHHLKNEGKIQFNKDISALLQGLQIKENLFPWHDLQISVNNKGMMKIVHSEDQKELIKLKTKQINNLDVLVYLVENPLT